MPAMQKVAVEFFLPCVLLGPQPPTRAYDASPRIFTHKAHLPLLVIASTAVAAAAAVENKELMLL